MQCLTDLTIFQYSDPLVLDHLSRSLLGVYTRRTRFVYYQRGAMELSCRFSIHTGVKSLVIYQ